MRHAEDLSRAGSIFGDWQETILWSCLQGVMGDVFYPDTPVPASAAAWLGDFCLVGGRADTQLILDIRARMEEIGQDFLILVPQDESWADSIEECLGTQAKRIVRYAIKKEADVFDVERLQAAVRGLEDGYELKLMDEELYHECLKENWSRDLAAQFKDAEMFDKLGVGTVILYNGRPVSGASSYSRYKDGIEIEIDTKPEFRRRGLAYACGAGLILECLSRGLYPSWDAHNRESAALAEKLGYHFDYEYPAYEVTVDERVREERIKENETWQRRS